MQAHSTSGDPVVRRHRPKTLTVFAAAFAAGAVLAYGVDRVVDVHVVQVEPQVESEPIFVALRSLPQGSPLTVWDVALKDWPKAMLPTTALKADASLEGMMLRHPIREGQPLLSVQLVRDTAGPPMTGVAALPPSAMPTNAGALPPTQPSAAAGGQLAPAVAEHFVPATPAEAPVAATRATEVVDVVAAPAEPEPAAESTATVPMLAVTDPDIDPRDSTDRPPSAPELEAVTVPTEVAAIESVTTPIAATPARVDAAEPPAGEPTVAPLLAAPVPALPTTDIERSLAAVGRTEQPALAATESVLDRTNRAPAPHAQPTSPRYHLVVPERVALAADNSFAQRAVPPVKPTPAPAAGAPATAQSGSRRVTPATSATTRQERTSPTGRRAAPTMRQPAVGTPAMTKSPVPNRPVTKRPVTKAPVDKQGATTPPATKPDAEPQSSRRVGLGAWFPQFSGATKQR